MILSAEAAAGIAAGTVDLAFRRWAQPRVQAGQEFLSSAGLIAIDAVTEAEGYTADEARRAGYPTVEALKASLRGAPDARLYRIVLRWSGPDPRLALSQNEDLSGIAERLAVLDRRGPWTTQVLTLIEANPERRAADLAAILGRETADFKVDVRKLKALGLTTSFEIGYRLSPRGVAYLKTLR